MYEFVEERVIKPYRSNCSNIMTQLRDILNEDYGIVTQFSLVGSGNHSRNLVTRNGNGPFDLDYNLLIVKMPDEYWDDLKKLKNLVRNTLNDIVGGTLFTDGRDSRSVITSILHFKNKPQVEFSFDIAIWGRNNQGNWCRLIHNKGFYEQFTWNEVPSSSNVSDKARELKEEGYWNDVRDAYLEKKNMYLRRGDTSHPSFIVFVETINEMYDRYL